MPQAFYPTVPFPIDHIIAQQHGGPTVLANLALSCLHDNSHKGPNIAGLDPLTKELTKLSIRGDTNGNAIFGGTDRIWSAELP